MQSSDISKLLRLSSGRLGNLYLEYISRCARYPRNVSVSVFLNALEVRLMILWGMIELCIGFV